MQPPFEVAEILQDNWNNIDNGELKLNSWHLRTLSAIKRCRTALLGKLDFTPLVQLMQTKNHQCPKCKNHSLQVIFQFDVRGPPTYWLEKIKKYKEMNIK